MEIVWLRSINQAKVLPFHPQLLRPISKKFIKTLSSGMFKCVWINMHSEREISPRELPRNPRLRTSIKTDGALLPANIMAVGVSRMTCTYASDLLSHSLAFRLMAGSSSLVWSFENALFVCILITGICCVFSMSGLRRGIRWPVTWKFNVKLPANVSFACSLQIFKK